jgi:hypothetical protein
MRPPHCKIRGIFVEYTPTIEPLSFDEAYLDVTENLKRSEIATEIATEIRARIRLGQRRDLAEGMETISISYWSVPTTSPRLGIRSHCKQPPKRPSKGILLSRRLFAARTDEDFCWK